jgi:hypothetical protein
VAGTANLQLDVDPKPQKGLILLAFPEVLSLAEMKSSISEQRKLHINVTRDGT